MSIDHKPKKETNKNNDEYDDEEENEEHKNCLESTAIFDQDNLKKDAQIKENKF